MDLFTMLVASNSLVVFVLCNLIIIILLFMGLKPTSSSTQESFSSAHEVPKSIKKEKERDEGFTSENTESSSTANVVEVSEAVSLPSDKAVSNEGTEVRENKDECKEEDDELRRRVEEFIEKVNRGWKTEKLMTFYPNRTEVPIWL